MKHPDTLDDGRDDPRLLLGVFAGVSVAVRCVLLLLRGVVQSVAGRTVAGWCGGGQGALGTGERRLLLRESLLEPLLRWRSRPYVSSGIWRRLMVRLGVLTHGPSAAGLRASLQCMQETF